MYIYTYIYIRLGDAVKRHAADVGAVEGEQRRSLRKRQRRFLERIAKPEKSSLTSVSAHAAVDAGGINGRGRGGVQEEGGGGGGGGGGRGGEK